MVHKNKMFFNQARHSSCFFTMFFLIFFVQSFFLFVLILFSCLYIFNWWHRLGKSDRNSGLTALHQLPVKIESIIRSWVKERKKNHSIVIKFKFLTFGSLTSRSSPYCIEKSICCRTMFIPSSSVRSKGKNLTIL